MIERAPKHRICGFPSLRDCRASQVSNEILLREHTAPIERLVTENGQRYAAYAKRIEAALQEQGAAQQEQLRNQQKALPSPATQRPCFDTIEGGRKRVSDTFTHKNSGSCI